MGLWSRKPQRTYFDDAQDLAYGPSGGPVKQWLSGVGLAGLAIVYGSICLYRGHTMLFGERGSDDVGGVAGFWLAIAYMAAGAFLHFHYFWGLSERLWRFSQLAKFLTLLVFLPSLLYAFYRYLV